MKEKTFENRGNYVTIEFIGGWFPVSMCNAEILEFDKEFYFDGKLFQFVAETLTRDFQLAYPCHIKEDIAYVIYHNPEDRDWCKLCKIIDYGCRDTGDKEA